MLHLFAADYLAGTHVQLPIPAGARIISHQLYLIDGAVRVVVLYEQLTDQQPSQHLADQPSDDQHDAPDVDRQPDAPLADDDPDGETVVEFDQPAPAVVPTHSNGSADMFVFVEPPNLDWPNTRFTPDPLEPEDYMRTLRRANDAAIAYLNEAAPETFEAWAKSPPLSPADVWQRYGVRISDNYYGVAAHYYRAYEIWRARQRKEQQQEVPNAQQ